MRDNIRHDIQLNPTPPNNLPPIEADPAGNQQHELLPTERQLLTEGCPSCLQRHRLMSVHTQLPALSCTLFGLQNNNNGPGQP